MPSSTAPILGSRSPQDSTWQKPDTLNQFYSIMRVINHPRVSFASSNTRYSKLGGKTATLDLFVTDDGDERIRARSNCKKH